MLAYGDMMQILTRMEQFYSDTFSYLQTCVIIYLMIAAGIVAIMGFLVPFVTDKRLRRSFKEHMASFRSDTIRRIEEDKAAFMEARKRAYHHSAMHWHEMSKIALKIDEWALAVRYLCYAINGACEADWPAGESRWQWLIDCLRKLQGAKTQQAITEILEIQELFDEPLGRLREKGASEPYTTLLSELETLREAKKEGHEGRHE